MCLMIGGAWFNSGNTRFLRRRGRGFVYRRNPYDVECKISRLSFVYFLQEI